MDTPKEVLMNFILMAALSGLYKQLDGNDRARAQEFAIDEFKRLLEDPKLSISETFRDVGEGILLDIIQRPKSSGQDTSSA